MNNERVAADRLLMARIDIAANSTLKALRNTLAYALLVSLFALLWFNAPSANGQSPVLDQVSVASAAAYSLRKVRAAYTGNAIRVRRSSDNAELDIGFTASGDLDTAALLTFVGSGSGFVTTWYDQSGNARNATQTTAGNQPRIVNAGVLDIANGKPAVRFNGSNTFFSGVSLPLSQITLSS
ncbi:MAG: arabinofuranosidase catalytic domain-containing protein, partial [Betaproteobacteria bacterium]